MVLCWLAITSIRYYCIFEVCLCCVDKVQSWILYCIRACCVLLPSLWNSPSFLTEDKRTILYDLLCWFALLYCLYRSTRLRSCWFYVSDARTWKTISTSKRVACILFLSICGVRSGVATLHLMMTRYCKCSRLHVKSDWRDLHVRPDHERERKGRSHSASALGHSASRSQFSSFSSFLVVRHPSVSVAVCFCNYLNLVVESWVCGKNCYCNRWV